MFSWYIAHVFIIIIIIIIIIILNILHVISNFIKIVYYRKRELPVYLFAEG